MTRHHAAVCTALECGPTVSGCVPSKNQRLKGSLDVGANIAVYNEYQSLVIEPAGWPRGRFPNKRKVFMRLRFAKGLLSVLALGICTASAGSIAAAQAPAAPAQQGLRQPDEIGRAHV